MKTIVQRIATGLCVLGGLAGCAAPMAKISTIPGMDITTKLGRTDYVVMGTATGQACAEENCFLGSCSTTAQVAGEEILDGRAQSSSLRDVNLNSSANVNPVLAFLLGVPAPAGPTGAEIAEKIARFKAIESIPNADALLSPRVDADVTESNNLFTKQVKSCVTVKGKEHAEDDVDVAVAAVLPTDIATERCVTTKAVPSGREPRRMPRRRPPRSGARSTGLFSPQKITPRAKRRGKGRPARAKN